MQLGLAWLKRTACGLSCLASHLIGKPLRCQWPAIELGWLDLKIKQLSSPVLRHDSLSLIQSQKPADIFSFQATFSPVTTGSIGQTQKSNKHAFLGRSHPGTCHQRQSPANAAHQCSSGTNICSSSTDICCSGPLECTPSFKCSPSFECSSSFERSSSFKCTRGFKCRSALKRSTAIQCSGILCRCTQRGSFGERSSKSIFRCRSFVSGTGIFFRGGTHFGRRTNLTSGHLWCASNICGNSTILTTTSHLTSTSVFTSTPILASTSILTSTSVFPSSAILTSFTILTTASILPGTSHLPTNGSSSASRASGSGTTLATATSGGSQTAGGTSASRTGSAATTTTTSSATAEVSSAKLDSATVGQNAAVTQVAGKPAVVMAAPANGKSSFTVEAKQPDDVKPGESIRVLATVIVGPSGSSKRSFLGRRQNGGTCQLQMQIDGQSVYDAQVSATSSGGATMDIATNGAQAATDMPKINVSQICGSTPVEVTVTNMFVTGVNGGVMNPDVGPSSTGSGGGNNGGSSTTGTTGSSTTSTQSATGTGGSNNNNAGYSALDASWSSIWALYLMVPAVVLAV
ncbi:unnamed protein product [Clonostachys rosea]|uniref:Uncharacterized protein n=1 Tax=Bionectria ochroleuca TaxID=29856 RepID=A0ABY6UGB1_BIOOC|nr:unnamed protein product [Clonostachys rosea]